MLVNLKMRLRVLGLRRKMYSITLDADNEKKTAKGMVRTVIKNQLKHAQY